MDMNVFAVKDEVVYPFYVTFDEKVIRDIQAKIDDWHGKGELMEIRASNLMKYVQFGKKIEVVSQKHAGKGKVFYYCCPTVETVDMYDFKFYQYFQHELSKWCDKILKKSKPLDFSECLSELLNWSSENEEEVEFINMLKKSFKYIKINIDEIVQSDLTVDEKKNILRRICDAIKNIKTPRMIVSSSKAYEEEVEEKIKDIEAFRTAFYHHELNHEEFKFTPEEKVAVRRKIFKSLPNVDGLIYND